MSRALAGPMITADILKLRRHRPTMAAAAALSFGVTALYLAVILARHNGQLPGARTLGDGTALMGLYFGSFAAILIGAEAGTLDVAAGVFRDLAATGRSRTALFLTRVPAAIAVRAGVHAGRLPAARSRPRSHSTARLPPPVPASSPSPDCGWCWPPRSSPPSRSASAR